MPFFACLGTLVKIFMRYRLQRMKHMRISGVPDDILGMPFKGVIHINGHCNNGDPPNCVEWYT